MLGIRHVIDCGKVKAKSFNASSGLDLLKVQNISKAQAWQRTGRAGRESRWVSVCKQQIMGNVLGKKVDLLEVEYGWLGTVEEEGST